MLPTSSQYEVGAWPLGSPPELRNPRQEKCEAFQLDMDSSQEKSEGRCDIHARRFRRYLDVHSADGDIQGLYERTEYPGGRRPRIAECERTF
jgi:hypothetical protein